MSKFIPKLQPSPASKKITLSPRKGLALLMLLILSIGLWYGFTFRTGHNWGGDNCMYVLHARNIAEGRDYQDTGLILNPKASIFPATYPPIYPLLLAPVYKVFGNEIEVFKFENLLLFLGTLLLISMFARQTLSRGMLLVLVAVIGFNPVFWDLKDNVISEVAFMLFLWTTILAAERAFRSENTRQKIVFAVVAGLSLYLTYGTRAAGFLLLPGLFLVELIRQRRVKVSGIIALVSLPLMLLQNIFLHSESMHIMHKLSHINPTLIKANILYSYPIIVSTFFNNTYSLYPTLVLTGILSLLALTGLMMRIRQGRWGILDVFFVLYVVLHLAARMNDVVPSQRYLIPVMPIFIFYFFVALQGMLATRLARITRVLFAVLMIAIAGSYGALYSRMQFGPLQGSITAPETVQMFEYIRTQTSPDDTIVFVEPRVMALYGERKSSHYFTFKQRDSSLKEAVAFFQTISADYWVTMFALPDEPRVATHLTLVFQSGNFHVYRIKNDAAGGLAI